MILLDYLLNILFATISAFGLAMVIYVCIHSDGPASQALLSFAVLGFGVGTLIFWNKNTSHE